MYRFRRGETWLTVGLLSLLNVAHLTPKVTVKQNLEGNVSGFYKPWWQSVGVANWRFVTFGVQSKALLSFAYKSLGFAYKSEICKQSLAKLCFAYKSEICKTVGDALHWKCGAVALAPKVHGAGGYATKAMPPKLCPCTEGAWGRWLCHQDRSLHTKGEQRIALVA